MYEIKALMGSDEDGGIYLIDVIEHENSLWVVPMWLVTPFLDYRMPKRIIKIEPRHYEKLRGNYPEILITYPIPNAILEGKEKRGVGQEYEAHERPQIKVPLISQLQ